MQLISQYAPCHLRMKRYISSSSLLHTLVLNFFLLIEVHTDIFMFLSFFYFWQGIGVGGEKRKARRDEENDNRTRF